MGTEPVSIFSRGTLSAMARRRDIVELSGKNMFNVYKTISNSWKNMYHVYKTISKERLSAFATTGKSL